MKLVSCAATEHHEHPYMVSYLSQVKSSQVNLIFRVAYVAQLLLGPLLQNLQVANIT